MLKKKFEPFIWSEFDSDPAHAIWIGSGKVKKETKISNSFDENISIDRIVKSGTSCD